MSAVSLGVVLLIACCMVCRITCQDYGDRPRALRNDSRVEDSQLCEENLCLNGGTCYWKTQRYSCQCPTAFTGRKCHILKAWPALRTPIGGRLVRTDEGVVVICKDSNFTILPVRDAHGRWKYGTGPRYCPRVNPRMWNQNRTDNASNPKENDTMIRFDLGRKNGFERHIQMLVERSMFKVMGSVDRRMQRLIAKMNQRIEVLEQRWSPDEQHDVDDIDVSDVESDPEEDFDSEGIDEETAKFILTKQQILRRLGLRVPSVTEFLQGITEPQPLVQPVQRVARARVLPPRKQRRYRSALLPGGRLPTLADPALKNYNTQ